MKIIVFRQLTKDEGEGNLRHPACGKCYRFRLTEKNIALQVTGTVQGAPGGRGATTPSYGARPLRSRHHAIAGRHPGGRNSVGSPSATAIPPRVDVDEKRQGHQFPNRSSVKRLLSQGGPLSKFPVGRDEGGDRPLLSQYRKGWSLGSILFLGDAFGCSSLPSDQFQRV